MNCVEKHLFGDGPKRILALDGGGIRGVISLQILKRIEIIVQSRAGPQARLSDYFDLIGGTSTGAIIAAGLSLGWEVDRLIEIYRRLGASVFQSEFFRRGLLRPKFDSAALEQELKKQFGDTRLGSSQLQTGLAVMLKRLDTGSPWIVSNNPRGKYYGPRVGRSTIPNKEYLLRTVVRASTAAPVYFDPETMAIAADTTGAFVDGGVSPHNNPALKLLMLATLKGHGLQWPVGEDRLLVVSVGTGGGVAKVDTDEVVDFTPVELGVRSLVSLMNDSTSMNETLLQWISSSPTARTIDREVGDLDGDLLTGEPLLTYQRYNVDIDKHWLGEQLGIDVSESTVDSLVKMDQPDNIELLTKIGEAAGRKFIDRAHFPAVFDIPEIHSVNTTGTTAQAEPAA